MRKGESRILEKSKLGTFSKKKSKWSGSNENFTTHYFRLSGATAFMESGISVVACYHTGR